MTKAAHFPASIPTSPVSADQSARDRSAADSCIAIIIFSTAGLLVSLVAALLGLPGA
jgi:hypothetical protein